METFRAIEEKINLNPILHNFQATANRYNIEKNLVALFLKSMENDLHKTNYDEKETSDYFFGSVEVVGLMCLRVFSEGNNLIFDQLSPYAGRLGSAFQKVNFLRDLHKRIKALPRSSRRGVCVAYMCYRALFKTIKNTPPELLFERRIRIANAEKAELLAYSFGKHQLNLI